MRQSGSERSHGTANGSGNREADSGDRLLDTVQYCRVGGIQEGYGWWTVLEPHLTDSYKKETHAARQQTRKDLKDENNALLASVRQMRGQQ